MRFCDAAFHRFHIGENKFQIYGFDIVDGIDLAGNVRYVFVVETPYDVHDRVHFPDVRQEFIAKTFALRRALDKPRDIHEFHGCGGDFFAVVKRREFFKPFVRHRDDAHVRLYRAKRIIRAHRACVCNCVEQRAFPDVGEPDYA